MKFKGTKKKWELFKTKSHCEIQTNIPVISICAVNPNVEEHLYNAQLISKAPEMLEFINSLLNESDDIVHDEIKKQAKKLIEEATKID